MILSVILTIVFGISTFTLAARHPWHLWDKAKDYSSCIRGKKSKFFSAERVIARVKKIHKSVDENGFIPGIVVGIAGGRYVGGTIIAYLLVSPKIGFVDKPAASLDLPRDGNGKPRWEDCGKCFDRLIDDLKDLKNKNILLVDDIAKEGDTTNHVVGELERLLELEGEKVEIRVAMIAARPNAVRLFNEKVYWDKRFCCDILPKQEMPVSFPWKS